MKDSLPNMDEVVRQVKVLLETIDAENGRISLAPAEARLLIEEREQDKRELKRTSEIMIQQNEIIADMELTWISPDTAKTLLDDVKSKNDRVAEQDKENQHYLQILEDIRIKALDESGSRFASYVLVKTHDERIKRPFG